MTVNLSDKGSVVAALGNLGSMETESMLRAVESAHRMILARKGKQKAAGGGKSTKELQSDLFAALKAEADNLPPAVQSAWLAIEEKGETQAGLEYHYLETFRDTVRAILSTRAVSVSLKGDGTMTVKRGA